MTGWWRRNAVALGAVAVLLPLTAGVVAVNEWSEFDAGHATRPVTVHSGDSTVYAGATVGPARAGVEDESSAPPGTKVVMARVLVDPGAEPIACSPPVLREIGGTQRQWNEASLVLDLPYDPERRSSCDSALPIRYSLTLAYIVPVDAEGPFTVDLETAAEYPNYVRLIVSP